MIIVIIVIVTQTASLEDNSLCFSYSAPNVSYLAFMFGGVTDPFCKICINSVHLWFIFKEVNLHKNHCVKNIE